MREFATRFPAITHLLRVMLPWCVLGFLLGWVSG